MGPKHTQFFTCREIPGACDNFLVMETMIQYSFYLGKQTRVVTVSISFITDVNLKNNCNVILKQ